MPDGSQPKLRQRLALGDRKEVGEAGAVAREVLDDPALTRPLVDLLEDVDEAVVAHAAHVVMQVGKDAPQLFEPHADRLLSLLRTCSQWEIGEQLPKVLVVIPLDDDQTQQLADMLVAQIDAKSNIAAASALSGLAELAQTGRIGEDVARSAIGTALASPRKALAARARRIAQKADWQ
ncbi:MAG: hypothetical protein JJ969_04435 [Rhizobiaceae bacterium]|nr:hypothetical protein [Rhizobiaceae bacterium]